MTQNSTTLVETQFRDDHGRVQFKTREVQSAPTAQRIRPFEIPTADQLLQDLELLRSDMVNAQETFDRQPELDAERNALKAGLATQVAEWKAKLASVEAELQRVQSLGSVREEFIKRVSDFENRASQIATATFHLKTEAAAHREHETSFRDLPVTLRETIDFKIKRVLKRFTATLFCRVHRIPQISNEQLEDAITRVYQGSLELENYIKS